jgi:hypothetical protein
MTCRVDGAQYVIQAAGEHVQIGTALGDYVAAYALPDRERGVSKDRNPLKRLRWSAVRPWLCGLKLRRQTKEHRLIAERRHELHPDREPLRGSVKRHGHGRIAGDVHQPSEAEAVIALIV